jgi:hypothetical protein
VIVGGSGGPWFMGIGRTLRAAVMSPFVRQRLRPFFSKPNREDLVVLKELAEAGDLTPVVDGTYPLAAAAEANGYVGERPLAAQPQASCLPATHAALADSERRTELLEQWDLWFPAVGATGLSFARSEVDAEATGCSAWNPSTWPLTDASPRRHAAGRSQAPVRWIVASRG